MAFPDSFQRKINSISRSRRLLFGLALQALIPFVSLYVALFLRLDLDPDRIDISAFWLWAPVLAGIRLLSLIQFGAHTGLWRYVSVPDLLGITKAASVSTIIFILILWLVINSPLLSCAMA